MNKIFLVVLATVILTSCGFGSSHSTRTTGTEAIVTECDTGYVLDNAKCIPVLAAPTVSNSSVALGTNSMSFKLNTTVKDMNGNVVDTGKIHYVSGLNCPDITCDSSGTTTYAGSAISFVSTDTTKITIFCIKAISCADGYKDSDVFSHTYSVGGPGGTSGNGNNTSLD